MVMLAFEHGYALQQTDLVLAMKAGYCFYAVYLQKMYAQPSWAVSTMQSISSQIEISFVTRA